MANLFSSSIGRKLVMSLSGLFLIMFLFVHLLVNSFLLLDPVFGTAEGVMFNEGVHFMGTNPLIRVIEPVLMLGFLIHIAYSFALFIRNKKARGNSKYSSGNKTKDVEWASKNMTVLGVALLAFLIVHFAQFWVKMKITGDPLLDPTAVGHGAYDLVHASFQELWIVVVYCIGSLALAFHMSHGFWSAFHTIGASNLVWIPRLQKISAIIAWIIGLGFCAIAIGQFLFFPLA